MKKQPTRFVGLDVSKAHRDIACRPGPTCWRVANDSAGIAHGLAHLRPLKPALIMLEATGGWQGPLVAALAVAKRLVAAVYPRQIRDCAKATGQVAKTDALERVCSRPLLRRCTPRLVHCQPRCPSSWTPGCSAGTNAWRWWAPSASGWRGPTRRSETASHALLTISSADRRDRCGERYPYPHHSGLAGAR